MIRVVYDDDLVTGLANGHCAGTILPESMRGYPLSRLRVADGTVVDAAIYDMFYIDASGVKHIVPGDDRQALSCMWSDDLAQLDGIWIVRCDDQQQILAAARASAVAVSGSGPTTLAGWHDLAASIVDAQAANAREAVGTTGYGQETEYINTEADARAFIAALAADETTDAADYPYLAAEIAAQAAATGETPDAETVAHEIITEAESWAASLAQIKQARRTAKLQIAAATDVAGIAAVLAGLSS